MFSTVIDYCFISDDPDQSDSNMPSQKTNVPRLSTDTKKKTASIEKRSLVTYDDTFDF